MQKDSAPIKGKRASIRYTCTGIIRPNARQAGEGSRKRCKGKIKENTRLHGKAG